MDSMEFHGLYESPWNSMDSMESMESSRMKAAQSGWFESNMDPACPSARLMIKTLHFQVGSRTCFIFNALSGQCLVEEAIGVWMTYARVVCGGIRAWQFFLSH